MLHATFNRTPFGGTGKVKKLNKYLKFLIVFVVLDVAIFINLCYQTNLWIFASNVPVIEYYLPYLVQILFFLLILEFVRFIVDIYIYKTTNRVINFHALETAKPEKEKPKEKKRGRPKGSKKAPPINPLQISKGDKNASD